MSIISQKMLEQLTMGVIMYLLILSIIVMIYLGPYIVTFWPLTLIYLTWMYYDRNTPYTNGRSLSIIRKSVLWRTIRSYFPQTLVKTAHLDPKGNYILALFPHGIFSTSAFCHFFSETSDFFKLYPGINVTPVTLDLNFRLPLIRELFLAAGACSCDKRSIMYRLTREKGGEAVLLIPGGAAEALLTVEGAYRLVLKERKGFIKLAHQAGASIVPVFAFGETNTYRHINFRRDSFIFKLQDAIKHMTGVALCVAWGRSIFCKSFGIIPRRATIVTVVGKPIKLEKFAEPPKDVVDASHNKFIKELINLFETHKHKYIDNPESAHLVIEE